MSDRPRYSNDSSIACTRGLYLEMMAPMTLTPYGWKRPPAGSVENTQAASPPAKRKSRRRVLDRCPECRSECRSDQRLLPHAPALCCYVVAIPRSSERTPHTWPLEHAACAGSIIKGTMGLTTSNGILMPETRKNIDKISTIWYCTTALWSSSGRGKGTALDVTSLNLEAGSLLRLSR